MILFFLENYFYDTHKKQIQNRCFITSEISSYSISFPTKTGSILSSNCIVNTWGLYREELEQVHAAIESHPNFPM